MIDPKFKDYILRLEMIINAKATNKLQDSIW
jgi:hypothetical protein